MLPRGGDPVNPFRVGAQGLGDDDAAVGLLTIF